ncbi:MAG: DNA-binding protein WhiA [Bacilli bacterium]|nr:DNA-binding protein WhiA [Bacilli bacterium]
MSYTVSIKEEISNINSNKSELIAELSGYIRNNGDISKDKITMTTENNFIVERVTNTIKDIYDIKPTVKIIENLNFSKKNLYQITISENTNTILKTLGIVDDNNNYLDTVPNYIVGGNEEIRGYLRGVFNGVGSINDPKKSRYHMELLMSRPEESVFVQKLLNLFDLNAKILNRDKGYMIYIKEAEKISDFLKILGANKAVMYYEDVRVYRDKKNKTNRLNNCEQANMDKIIETATAQLEDIDVIEKNDGVVLLDDKVKEVLNYRKKYPEASLKELAEIISLETNKSITKSGLNHRLRKLKELADGFRKMNKGD